MRRFRGRGQGVVVVTDLRETLAQQHRRRIRIRLVAMAVWIAGWVVAGALWRDGWLATAILLGSGPGIWVLWWLVAPRHETGRREAVRRRGRRELPGGPAAHTGAADPGPPERGAGR